MNQKSLLKIRQKIQVTRKERTEWFNSIVEEIRTDKLYITVPYSKERPLVLKKNDVVKVRFASKQASYIFETRVTGQHSDNIILFSLAYPQEITRVQQRRHVRLPVMLDVEYKIDSADNKRESFIQAHTLDLSGGGMCLAVKVNIEPGTRLLLAFTVPMRKNPQSMEIEATVARSIKVEPDREIYQLGLRFENISLQQEDKIVRFVFERMAQQQRLR